MSERDTDGGQHEQEVTHSSGRLGGVFKIVILIVAVCAFALGAVIDYRRGSVPGSFAVTVLGGVAFLVGLAYVLFEARTHPVLAELSIGNLALRIGIGLALMLVGGIAIGYAGLLESKAFLSSDTLSEAIERMQNENEADVKPAMSEDDRTLLQVNELYVSGMYDACLALIDKAKTKDDGVLDELLYYSIMARYRTMEISVRRFDSISESERADLESRFRRFLAERPESKRFSTVHYWFGHFYFQVVKDREAALQTFDDIITEHFYSDWVQGALYYSAILHYRKGTPEEKEIAAKRLTILRKSDGPLQIVELGRDFDGAGLAKQLLNKWNLVRADPNRYPDHAIEESSPEALIVD